MPANKLSALAAVAVLILPQVASAQNFVSVNDGETVPILLNFPTQTANSAAAGGVDDDGLLLSPVVGDEDPGDLDFTLYDHQNPDDWAATPGPEGNRGECNDGTVFDVEISRCVSF